MSAKVDRLANRLEELIVRLERLAQPPNTPKGAPQTPAQRRLRVVRSEKRAA